MEIKEAIEVLKSNYPDAHYSMVREAVDIAIATMEEQMSSRPCTAGRLIDADALDRGLHKAKRKYLVYKNNELAENVLFGIHIAEEAIKNATTIIN